MGLSCLGEATSGAGQPRTSHDYQPAVVIMQRTGKQLIHITLNIRRVTLGAESGCTHAKLERGDLPH
jgi:hypothetical protein